MKRKEILKYIFTMLMLLNFVGAFGIKDLSNNNTNEISERLINNPRSSTSIDDEHTVILCHFDMSGESSPSNSESVVVSVPIFLQFCDANAVIACNFENSWADINNHAASGNAYNFTSVAIEGNLSLNLDDTNDYVRWRDGTDYTQGTWECFMIPEQDSSVNSDYVSILSVSSGYTPLGALYYKEGLIGAHHSDGSSWTPEISYAMNLKGGQAYHFAYTFGSSGTFLYVNGELVNSSADTRRLSTSNYYFGIGAIFTYESPKSFPGTYDLVRFSDIQRTSFPVADALLSQGPASPLLDSLKTPDFDGKIILTWGRVLGTKFFTIYRHHSFITEINGSLTEVGTTPEFRFVDIVLSNGTFYYAVTASNMFGESSPSQTESVEILVERFPPSPPILYPSNSPTENSTYTVSWSPVEGSDNYLLFRETSMINSSEGLIPIMSGNFTSFIESGLTDGIYYYCVVATNEFGQSELSNIDLVIIASQDDLPEYKGNIPGFSTRFLVILMGLTSLGLIQTVMRNIQGKQPFFTRSSKRRIF